MVAWVLVAVAFACAGAYVPVFGRPRAVPAAGRGAGGAVAADISVVVPARDEERNLGRLLRSLAAESEGGGVREVVVVDDGSVDRTPEVAREFGAVVVPAGDLPDGWRGKPWACQRGAGAAVGEWLLFLDADTWLEEGALVRLAGLATAPDRVVSVCPFHEVRRPYEQLSAFFNALMAAGVGAFGGWRETAGRLSGQVMLTARETYLAHGGHGSVRGEVLENFHLARHLARAGVRCETFLGEGVVSMRMFPAGFGQLSASWKKGFVSGAGGTDPWVLALASLWLTGAGVAAAAVALALAAKATGVALGAAIAAYAVYSWQCVRVFSVVGRFPPVVGLLYPVPLAFYQVLFFGGALDRWLGRKQRWKGREVD